MQEIRQFADAIQKHPELTLEHKLQLLSSASGEPLADELLRFVTLVFENKRIEHLLRMLSSFLDQYRTCCGIKVGRLVTACPIPQLKASLESLMQNQTGAVVQLEESVDAPVSQGQRLGTMTVRSGEQILAQVPMVAQQAVPRLSWWQIFSRVLRQFTMGK
jgi:F-type H+-transporting ATPase subunit delta